MAKTDKGKEARALSARIGELSKALSDVERQANAAAAEQPDLAAHWRAMRFHLSVVADRLARKGRE